MPSTSTDRLNGLTTSLAVKAPCRVATTANITLSGLQTINSVTVVENDRVLVWNQTDQTENGIYLASTSDWTRAKDFNGNRDVVQGTIVPVVNGSSGANLYEVTASNPITIGTTNITFSLRYGANVRYDQTAAEIAATVTPTDYAYEAGDIRRYGATCDNSTDSLAAFVSALAQHEQGGAPVKVVMDGSGYVVSGSVSIDFADCRIETYGLPVIRTTNAAAPVVFFDGGVSTGTIYRCFLGDCILDGGTYGLHIRSCHRSEFHARGRNHSTAMLRTEFSILNLFYLVCTVNDESMTTTPPIGASLYRRGASENTVACTFINPIFEGIGVGFDFEDAKDNVVLGGSSEGCTTGGVRIRSGSDMNTFIDHYCELNAATSSNYDFRIAGSRNRLINCDLRSGSSNLGLWIENGRMNSMEGGFIVNSQIDASAERTRLAGVYKDSGTHTDNGSETLLLWIDGDGVDFPRSVMDYLGPNAPTLLNSWANYGSGYQNAGYYRDAFDIVHLQGCVYNGTVNTIFTMEAGFRPLATRRFLVAGSALTNECIIDIQSDGDVVFIAGNNAQVSLDGISFLADGS